MFKFNFEVDASGAPRAAASATDLVAEHVIVPPSNRPPLTATPLPRTLLRALAAGRALPPPAQRGRLVRARLYEGADEAWECAADLAAHLRRTRPCAAHVLELGAGRGEPGSVALCGDARRVVFQDLDAETLQSVTARSVARACARAGVPLRARKSTPECIRL